ncbi:MAG: glutaredoxin family protein [Candidatus Binatia bacterium]
MPAIALALYSRPGCHLCDEMKAVIVPLVSEFGCSLDEIDISGQAELEARFGTEIPVLCVNGRKAFKYRVTEPELRRRLAREGGVEG